MQPAKVPAALYAIQSVLVKARGLAATGADAKTLYRILDWAEILPSLITLREEDTTEVFREILAGLGEDFPECQGFLSNFDKGVSWSAPSPQEARAS